MSDTPNDTLAVQRMLRRSLDGVEVSEPQSFGGLTVWYLQGGAMKSEFALLDNAIEQGDVEIREVNGGSVPGLTLDNRGERPVLLVDGEELIGGMQNRCVNISILAPAGEDITLPVSCLEAGRWGYASPDPSSDRGLRGSNHLMTARLRGAKMTHVVASMSEHAASRRSDQSAVWEQIDALSDSLDARSETNALSIAFERHDKALRQYVAALRPRRWTSFGASGAVFAIDGGPHGLDLFDARPAFKHLLPKLIRSWALDAIAFRRSGLRGSSTQVEPRILLDRLARSRSRVFPAVGLGVDAVIQPSGSRLHGGALVTPDGPVHISAFHSGFGT